MAKDYTEKYKLVLPEGPDYYTINDANTNAIKIENALTGLDTDITNLELEITNEINTKIDQIIGDSEGKIQSLQEIVQYLDENGQIVEELTKSIADKVSNETLDEYKNEISAYQATIDEKINDINTSILFEQLTRETADNEIDERIGDLSTLTTANKNDLVRAINEVDGDIGSLSSLNIQSSSIVNAINSVLSQIDNNSEENNHAQTEIIELLNKLRNRFPNLLLINKLTDVVGPYVSSSKISNSQFNIKLNDLSIIYEGRYISLNLVTTLTTSLDRNSEILYLGMIPTTDNTDPTPLNLSLSFDETSISKPQALIKFNIDHNTTDGISDSSISGIEWVDNQTLPYFGDSANITYWIAIYDMIKNKLTLNDLGIDNELNEVINKITEVDNKYNYITAIDLGVNDEDKTLKVHDYTLMNNDGSIPIDRIADESITMTKLSDEVKTYIDESTGDLSAYYTKIETDNITGNLSTLTTDNKTNLVSAINEIDVKETANIKKNPDDTTGDIIDTHLTIGTRTGDCGEKSFTSGYSHTASGQFSACVGGHGNKVTEYDSACLGGYMNECTAQFAVCAGGYMNECTARSAVCAGGHENQCSGTRSACIGGYKNTSSEEYSVCIGGNNNTASGRQGICLGGNNNTAEYFQVKMGHYSKLGEVKTDNYDVKGGDALIIGNGSIDHDTDVITESNAFRVAYNGGVYGTRAYSSSGADYAEFFEWQDGNPDNEDRRGLFVTLDGEKICLCNSGDYILGVVSSIPSVCADSASENWHGMYEINIFGDFIYDANGRPKISSEYDPNKEYVPREKRPEWAAIGLLGKVIVTDDGTCEPNGYCVPSKDGIATASESGYRVLSRINETHIKILMI